MTVMAAAGFPPGRTPFGKHIWIGIGPEPRHRRRASWAMCAPMGAGRRRPGSSTRAQLYYPFAQVPDELLRRWSELMSIAVRTGIDPLSVVEPLRREGARAVFRRSSGSTEVHTHGAARQKTRSPHSVSFLLLFAIFAGLALLLACIGHLWG